MCQTIIYTLFRIREGLFCRIQKESPIRKKVIFPRLRQPLLVTVRVKEIRYGISLVLKTNRQCSAKDLKIYIVTQALFRIDTLVVHITSIDFEIWLDKLVPSCMRELLSYLLFHLRPRLALFMARILTTNFPIRS